MNLVWLGLVLVALGITLIFLGSVNTGNTEYAGVLMIGPIPLVFGNSKNAVYMALGLGVLMVLITWLIISQIQM